MDAPTKGHFRLAGKEFPAVTWWKQPQMRKTYIYLMFVILTSATNGFDGSMVNGLLALDQFKEYFNNPKGSIVGLFSSIMPLGSLIALPVVPYAADILGRRMAIFIGCWIMIFGVALQTASVNFRMFVAARFFIGFGVAISHGASPLLITELVHPQHRATMTTIYNTTWYLGSIIAAWLTFGTNHIGNSWSWRIPSIVQAGPSVCQIAFVWLVPESPRWQIHKGHDDKALAAFAKVHAEGNTQDELVQLEFEEIKHTLKMEKEFESNGWMELIRTKGNRRRVVILATLGLFSQWSGNGLVSYYMTAVLTGIGIEDSDMQLVINGVLQICNAIVATACCFVVDRFGRRRLFLTSVVGMMGCFIIWTICSARFDLEGGTNHKMGNAVVAMIFLYYVFYNMAWSGLLVGYSVEILPYNIRAKGMCIVWFTVDAALFINTYVNPVALDAIGWRYYIVYCIWLGIELAVVYFFYIETRNTPLEEIAKHFDGDAALVGGAAATEKGKVLATEMALGSEKGPTVVDDRVVDDREV